MQETITDQIAANWNKYEAKWVEENGTKEGFAEWFADQLVKMMTNG